MTKNTRHIELGKIHMGAKQLRLDDVAYRDLLWIAARVQSSKDLDEHGRKTVIAHLVKCGAVFTRKKRPRPAKDRQALVSKVRAFLAEAKRPDAYADGMAKHMFKVDRYEWLDTGQLHKMVAALTYDAVRHNRRTE